MPSKAALGENILAGFHVPNYDRKFYQTMQGTEILLNGTSSHPRLKCSSYNIFVAAPGYQPPLPLPRYLGEWMDAEKVPVSLKVSGKSAEWRENHLKLFLAGVEDQGLLAAALEIHAFGGHTRLHQ